MAEKFATLIFAEGDLMLQPKLKKVVPVEPYFLRLYYSSGEIKLFDVSPYIASSWYGELKDFAYFRTVRLISGGVGIEWNNGQDISPNELYENSISMKGR